MFERFKNMFLLFWFIFFISALTSIEGQYTSSQCDHNRLQRCQQDITTNIQEISNTQSSSGSGYSGISSGYQSGSHSDTNARCSALRQNLDCLLTYTPACHINRTSYDSRTNTYDSTYRNNPGDFIRRGRQTIERFCEQTAQGGSWRVASCYTRQEIRNCEGQYRFSSSPPPVSVSACNDYRDFRDCVVRVVRNSCSGQDLQLMATYLIDKTSELSWSCVTHSDYGNSRMDTGYDSNYNSGGSRFGGHNYDNRNYDDRNRDRDRDRDRVYDSNRDRNPNYDTNRDRDRFGSNYDNRGSSYNDRDRYGSSGGIYQGSHQDPTGSGTAGQGIDRYGGSFYPTTDSCLERAGYFVRSCEDTLIQRQRDAREGRSSNDVQRRICCALFFYRDCISRVVVDRCRDPSPTVVDILMGSRKRDLTVTCREYSRDQCSSSSLIKSSFSLFIILLISIRFLRNNTF